MKNYLDMKLTFISDTHGLHDELNEWLEYEKSDFIIHSGDVSNVGQLWDIERFLEWFSNLDQFKHKIFIAGNHDFGFQNQKGDISNLLNKYPNVIYLENQEITLEGVTFYGSPYTPVFYDWAFMKERGNHIEQEWVKIPKDTDVLITHGPPFGVGDLTPDKINTGCLSLLDAVREVKPFIHCFGHIHHGNGLYKNEEMPTIFINSSVVNEQYRVVNKPISRYVSFEQLKANK